MSDHKPLEIYTRNRYVTDEDRAHAMRITLATGRMVVVRTRPRRRWWQFWKRDTHD